MCIRVYVLVYTCIWGVVGVQCECIVVCVCVYIEYVCTLHLFKFSYVSMQSHVSPGHSPRDGVVPTVHCKHCGPGSTYKATQTNLSLHMWTYKRWDSNCNAKPDHTSTPLPQPCSGSVYWVLIDLLPVLYVVVVLVSIMIAQ